MPMMQSRRDLFEMALVTAVAWIALVSIPIGLGGIGISWDALNHHAYLGWTAFAPRFDFDWLAASYQAYQYPYLYWPFYKLVEMHASGMLAGVVLVSLHVLTVPALWIAARVCVPVHNWEGTVFRAGAVMLALLGQLTLSLMDSTANDLYAASPLVWSVALGMLAADPHRENSWWTSSRLVCVSGALAGVAVAFKFSNGPLVLVMPAVWAMLPGTASQRLIYVLRAGVCCIGAFLLVYGWWGWQMWRHFGNPMYPFESLDPWFAWLRDLTDWREP